jgi:hypothetical protein
MRSRRHLAPLVLVVVACGPEQDPGADDDVGSSGSDETGADASFPAACNADESPFVSADCLAALRDVCRAHSDETACTSQATFEFDGYAVRCGWANVLTFADATSCTIASEAGRCEAMHVAECLWPCTAIPSELEIVELCDGPLGPWSAVDSEDDVSSCAPNTTPPAPALCDCAPSSCDVE